MSVLERGVGILSTDKSLPVIFGGDIVVSLIVDDSPAFLASCDVGKDLCPIFLEEFLFAREFYGFDDISNSEERYNKSNSREQKYHKIGCIHNHKVFRIARITFDVECFLDIIMST